jgi:hypothetical protein
VPEADIPWAQASIDDAAAFDFSLPPSTETEASAHVLGRIYRMEQEASVEDGKPDESRARVLSMLASALQMHEQLHLPKSPYGPMMQMEDRRTAVPADWQGGSVAVLECLGEKAINPVIRARLFDVAWYLQRNRVQTGHQAAGAYLDMASGVCAEILVDSTDAQVPGIKTVTLENALRRGLQICGQLRPNEPELSALTAFVLESTDRFEAAGEHEALLAMLTLAYDFELGDQSACAARIERVADVETKGGPNAKSSTLVLAAKAWRRVKDVEAHERCFMRASEVLVAHAKSIEHAFSASHWLQQAIDLLRGLRSPAAKERKRDLRIDLIRMQAAAEDEMGVFEHPIDLTRIIEDTTARLKGVTLIDGLFVLASIIRSREPAELIAEARRSIAQHPLSAMFGVQQHDADGYVRYRAQGAAPGQESPEALEHHISRDESTARSLIVEGQIRVVIRNLAERFPIGKEDLLPLCRESPFVPTDLSRTYARGLTAFCHGDMTAALAILTPLLEASLVYVLKGHDIDVVRHDEDAGTQEDMTITQLFKNHREELDTIFGEAITADIDRVFLARSGPGLRHAVAHGTMSDLTPYTTDAIYACWLIFHLCLLPLFIRYKDFRAGPGAHMPEAAAQYQDPPSVSSGVG